MLTKTELIEKLNEKLSKIKYGDNNTTIYIANQQGYESGLNEAKELAEQLPDTSELQAENEVLKERVKVLERALHNTIDDFSNYCGINADNCFNGRIRQAQKEIDDGL